MSIKNFMAHRLDFYNYQIQISEVFAQHIYDDQ